MKDCQLDFLIVGAQKAGTSWLHHHLRGHTGIYLPRDKDFELLSYASHVTDTGWQQRYGARFAQRADGLVGDACASLLWNDPPLPAGFNPAIPETVIDLWGDHVKLIALLRDPVERAVSAYLHHLSHASLDWNCPILDAPGELGLLEMGRYGAHLAHWAARFRPGQLLILPSPGEAEPTDILAAALSFLGLTPGLEIKDVRRTIFPGLHRHREPGTGLWLRRDHPALARQPAVTRRMPVRRHDDSDWLLVINRQEFEALREFYVQDAAVLQSLLRRRGDSLNWCAPWLSRYVY